MKVISILEGPLDVSLTTIMFLSANCTLNTVICNVYGYIQQSLFSSPKLLLGTIHKHDADEEMGKLKTLTISKRGSYAKVMSDQGAKVTQYAFLHGEPAAACYFSVQRALGMNIKESSCSMRE